MRISTHLIAFALFVPLAAVAADKHENTDLDRPISIGELTPTPEMWFYQQELKASRDPKLAVRQKAQYQAAQRQLRLAAQRWYGVHPARPNAITTPFQGESYSPAFRGGRDPNQWPGTVSPTVIMQSRRDNYRSTW
jgi:hypothetical protein